MNPNVRHSTDKDLALRKYRRPFLTAIVAIGVAYGYYLHVVHVELKDLKREAADARAKGDTGAFERAALLHNAVLDTVPGRTVAWGHEITKIPVETSIKSSLQEAATPSK